jgi:beta-lactamase superfamily II metal-dependent hydrolase
MAHIVSKAHNESNSKTNDNSVAILLSYGTVRVLLAGDAEARKSTWRAVRTPIL